MVSSVASVGSMWSSTQAAFIFASATTSSVSLRRGSINFLWLNLIDEFNMWGWQEWRCYHSMGAIWKHWCGASSPVSQKDTKIILSIHHNLYQGWRQRSSWEDGRTSRSWTTPWIQILVTVSCMQLLAWYLSYMKVGIVLIMISLHIMHVEPVGLIASSGFYSTAADGAWYGLIIFDWGSPQSPVLGIHTRWCEVASTLQGFHLACVWSSCVWYSLEAGWLYAFECQFETANSCLRRYPLCITMDRG